MAAGLRRPISPWRPALTALALAILVACASGGGSLRVARDAEAEQQYDLAVAEYTKLLREHPENRDARQGLERAKLRASQDHFTSARRLSAPESSKKHSSNYRSPPNSTPRMATSSTSCRNPRQLRTEGGGREDGKTRLESVIADSLQAPLPGTRSADRCHAARFARLPRRELARRLLCHRQVLESQHRVRSDVSRSAGLDRPARRPSKRR